MSDLNERVEETIDSHQAPDYKPERAASLWGDAWRDLRKRPSVIISGLVILIVMVMGFFPELFTSVNPKSCNIALSKQGPTEGHPFGFSAEGCDYFAQTIHGAGPSIKLSLLVVAGTLVIGGLFGIIAGYYGGKVNMVIMRTMDVFFAFPSVLLAVAIAGSLGGGIGNQMLTLTVVLIPPICRVAETATLQVRTLDFVDAARASGASTISILFTHVLINVLSPVLVYSSTLVSISIILASGLSFLGLGVSPPTADWGLMLSTLRQSIYVQPLVTALPGVLILITSIAFNLVSDGLRQAMDVKA